LVLYARSWGKLTPEEESTIKSVDGAFSEYGDNGFSKYGTKVVVRREAGHLLKPDEVETILAPLAGHVLRYFELSGVADPGDKQPDGNFSSKRRATS
jgi:hypothetical protein